jgi:hypothetical protein
MNNAIKNILANVNISASYDIGNDEYFREEPLQLQSESDPFLCIMLSGMSPKSVFENYDYADEDLMLYILGPDEVAKKISNGDKLRPAGQHTKIMVDNIREYYTNRLIEEKLTGKVRSNSDFSTDLMMALNIRGSINPKYVGLYNKLWDMYDSDIAWDMFVDNCKSASKKYDVFNTRKVDLKFYTSVYGVSNKKAGSRKQNYTRYYFIDKEKNLYEHSVLTSSPIKLFLENYFQTFNASDKPWKSVHISVRQTDCPVPVYKDEFMYYKILDWAGLDNTQDKNNYIDTDLNP